jgi:predicted ATPase/class 3 adenylate cyclase
VTAQPTGTVTLLFTDVEGSTTLLDRLGAEWYAETLELHRSALRAAFETYGGFEFGTEGDAFFVAFARAEDAVAAAAAGQQALAAADWPDGADVRVRIGIHTGEPLPVEANYVGMDLHRVARIMSAGHGGQVVVSESTAALLDGDGLRDLGPHRLKDLLEPIRLYQLEIDGLPDEFPPLRSLHRTNLPVAAWPLLGRERELGEIRRLLDEGGARLVTLTGPGGSGKTRLALQAAADLSDEYPDGTFFVALAPLRDLSAVQGTVAEAVGLQPDDDVAAWLASRRALLVLDNLEHLRGVDAVVAQLRVGDTTLVATSRAPLRLAGERELAVEPLPEDAAVELFVSRAAAAGRQVEADETVAEVCRRLDNLPLALELAAARSKLLSPSALLQRLDEALPLLTGGASDRPERQRTLRATIEWSHDLLDPDAQTAFRRLSVFRGSFTLDAAEAITGADLDHVATLLDQSLLKPLGDDRFFLLETIREYTRERLDEAGEAAEFGMRHARWYLERLEEYEPELWGSRRDELLGWSAEEWDNLRAMLDRLTADALVDAARAATLLYWYGFHRGSYSEERQRLRALLARDELPDASRGALLYNLAWLEVFAGDLEAQEAAAREALPLIEPKTYEHASLFIALGFAAVVRRRPDDAVRFARQALEEAGDSSSSCTEMQRVEVRANAATILGEAGETETARTLTREALAENRAVGSEYGEATSAASLAEFDLYEHDYRAAHDVFVSTLATARRLESSHMETEVLRDLGYALLGLEQHREARTAFLELLELALINSSTPTLALADALSGLALSADPSDARSAPRLRAATIRHTANLASWPRITELEHHFEQPFIDTIGQEAWDREQAVGAKMTLEEAIELARSLAGVPAPDPP